MKRSEKKAVYDHPVDEKPPESKKPLAQDGGDRPAQNRKPIGSRKRSEKTAIYDHPAGEVQVGNAEQPGEDSGEPGSQPAGTPQEPVPGTPEAVEVVGRPPRQQTLPEETTREGEQQAGWDLPIFQLPEGEAGQPVGMIPGYGTPPERGAVVSSYPVPGNRPSPYPSPYLQPPAPPRPESTPPPDTSDAARQSDRQPPFQCPNHPEQRMGFFDECPECRWKPWRYWLLILAAVTALIAIFPLANLFNTLKAKQTEEVFPTAEVVRETQAAGFAPLPPQPAGTIQPSLTASAYPSPVYTFTPTHTRTIAPTATSTATNLPTITGTPLPLFNFIVETVDRTGKVGAYNSLAFDRNNTAVIAYLKLNLKSGVKDFDQQMIARQSGSAWEARPITDGSANEGVFNVLKADSGGNLHLAYYSYTKELISYNYSNTGGVSWSGAYGAFPARRDPTNNDIRPRPSLAIDAARQPLVVFFEPSLRKLLQADSSRFWAVEEIASNVTDTGQTFPAVVAKNNQLVVAYFDTTRGLVVLRRQSGYWAADPGTEKLGFGWFPALAVDGLGNLHLSYFDSLKNQLKYAYHDGARWSEPVILDENGGKFNSIAVASDGTIHIAYAGDFSASEWNLKYVVGRGLGFGRPQTLFKSILIDGNQQHLSLALDKNGQPWVSFYDQNSSDRNLKIARGQR